MVHGAQADDDRPVRAARPTLPVMSAAGERAPTVAELLARGPTVSFELFPPKTDDGERHLWTALRELEALHPDYVSVTYGAGGSTRDRTTRLTARLARETTLVPMAHLTCVGASRAQLRQVIGGYVDAGVRSVLALRGDPPDGPTAPWEPHPEGLQRSVELVALLKELADVSVGVAAFPEGHPEAASLDDDAAYLAAKQDAGADFAVTQFFFEADDYFRLVERAARHGATLPVVPGVMPVTGLGQIRRMAQMQGSELPRRVVERLEAVADDPAAVRAVGVDVATELCERLLDGGVPGLHFYTLNRSTATREVAARLGLAPVPA